MISSGRAAQRVVSRESRRGRSCRGVPRRVEAKRGEVRGGGAAEKWRLRTACGTRCERRRRRRRDDGGRVAARSESGEESPASIPERRAEDEDNEMIKVQEEEEEEDDDGRADVYGDAFNETLRDGRSKAEVMKDFMWTDTRTEAEKSQEPTVPWWAGRRVMSSNEFEPDLRRDPKSWFEERKEPAPFTSIETAAGGRKSEEQYNWMKATTITEVRRPHMRRNEELNKQGEPRVAYTKLDAGMIFKDVPIASKSWNIGIGIDVGADYDAGVLFTSEAWDDDVVQKALEIGKTVDVRITHVRDPHRYIWAVECELLGMDDIVSRLPLLGYPLLHIRPEDQTSLDKLADIIEAAGRPAPVFSMDATERAKDRTQYMKKKARGTLNGDPHELVSFAEDFEEVELILEDPTVRGENIDKIAFYRARNAYFVHRYLWETGEDLGNDCPDFMFRNSIPGKVKMHPDEVHWSHEKRPLPRRPPRSGQYPLTQSYSYWRPKEVDNDRKKRAARPYTPTAPVAARFKKVGIGNGFVKKDETAAALIEVEQERYEANILAGDTSRYPIELHEEHMELIKDAIVMRRRIRRDIRHNPSAYSHVIPETKGAETEEKRFAAIAAKLEPRFETELDVSTGKITLKRVVDIRQQFADASTKKVDESEYEDVVRFTERDLESFIDIDEIAVDNDE